MPTSARESPRRLGKMFALALVLPLISAGGGAPFREQQIQSGSPDAERASSRAFNPHWTPDGCRYCHPTDAPPAPIPPAEAEDICLSCHDGRKAKRERHPIGRTFDSEQVTRPDGWPTVDGQLTCATCHAISEACHAEKRGPRGNSAFLRSDSTAGPLAFCAQCHVDETVHQRYKAHAMLDEAGTPIKEACLFCHESMPDDLDRLTRTGQPALRADVISLCLGCHPRHVDFFEPGHIGVRVTAKIKAQMIAAEQKASGRSSRAAALGAPPAITEPTHLPLAGGDTVVCSTCHNPHQAGVFPANSVLADGAPAPGEERQTLRLRRSGKEICFACHAK